MSHEVDLAYRKLESEIYEYLSGEERVVGAIIVGSRTFSHSKHTDSSDLDVVIYTEYPDFFINNEDWMNTIRDLKSSYVHIIEGLSPIVKAEFTDGLKVDFAIATYDREGLEDQLLEHPEFTHFNEYFAPNIRLFLDKEGLLKGIIELLKGV